MSALEDWRAWWEMTGGWTRLEGMLKADAAIAELECEASAAHGAVDFWQTAEAKQQKRAEQAEAEVARLKGRRCRDCGSWDKENAEEVAAVRFAFCKNRIATKEFKTSVVSEGWLCPCWTARAEEGSRDE